MNATNNQFSITRIASKPAQCLGRIALTAALVIGPPAVHGQTLAQALNATNLTWTTSGTSGSFGWSAETSTTHDGVSAADSGQVYTPSATSTLRTTVNGPDRKRTRLN